MKANVPDRIYGSKVTLAIPSPEEGSLLTEVVAKYYLELQNELDWPSNSANMQPGQQNIEALINDYKAGRRIVYHIYNNDNLDFIGRTGFFEIDWDLKVAKIGFWSIPSARGTGAMPEAVQCVIRLAQELKFTKLIVETKASNTRAIKFAKNMGFTMLTQTESRRALLSRVL